MRGLFFGSIIVLLMLLTGCSSKKRTLPELDENADIILTMFSWDGKTESKYLINSLGHSFVSVKNQSDESIFIKDYEIKKDDELCFGTWGITDKWGICYDLEPSFIKYYDRYENRVSLSVEISKEDVNTINDIIDTSDEWTFLKNCSYFATKIWNNVVDDEYQIDYSIYTSAVKLVKSIKRFDCYETNKPIICHDNVFYFDEGVKYQMVFSDNL